MNIFILDLNILKAAQAHCDKHVVKMLLESIQLLYTAHWALAFPELAETKSPIALSKLQKKYPPPSSLRNAPPAIASGQIMRPCHINHPCALWTRESLANYIWLCEFAIALAKEFELRYVHTHSCAIHASWLLQNPSPRLPKLPLTQFAIAMDDVYKVSQTGQNPDPLLSYRNYYNTSKKERGLLKYTRRQPPDWLTP